MFVILLLSCHCYIGWVTNNLRDIPGKNGVVPLLDMIVKHIPPPIANVNDSFALSVNTIATDNHLGRIVTGKVEAGTVNLGDKIKVMTREGKEMPISFKVTKLFFLQGLQRVDVERAHAGTFKFVLLLQIVIIHYGSVLIYYCY